MKVYLVIHSDRHVDPYIVPHKDREKALADAEDRARDMAAHYHVAFRPALLPSSPIFRFAVEDVGEIRVEEKELIE